MSPFGANRHFSVCAACGHPAMAHFPGPCHCGCRHVERAEQPQPRPARAASRRASVAAATPAQRPSRGRRPRGVAASERAPAAAGGTGSQAQLDLLAFLDEYASRAEAREFLRRTSAALGAPLHPLEGAPVWPQLRRFVLGSVPPRRAAGYLDALRRRLADGERLVRGAPAPSP